MLYAQPGYSLYIKIMLSNVVWLQKIYLNEILGSEETSIVYKEKNRCPLPHSHTLKFDLLSSVVTLKIYLPPTHVHEISYTKYHAKADGIGTKNKMPLPFAGGISLEEGQRRTLCYFQIVSAVVINILYVFAGKENWHRLLVVIC